MGIVYLALDLLTEQKVILKKGLESNEVFGFGLRNEIAVLKQLNHHSIPQYIDHFAIDDALVLVIEFIDGENLNELLAKEANPIGFEKLIDWAMEILDVLDYLHKFKPPIIHRDIKPHNIMLDRNQHIKLIDYGISKDTAQTKIDGSSPWSPPEQVFRDWGGTTERSDIFSLGASFYWLATRRLATPSKYRLQMLTDGLPDPLVPISLLNPTIPESFSKIIRKAMEPTPDKRYQTAWAMKIEVQEEKRKLSNKLPTTKPGVVQEPRISEIEPNSIKNPLPNTPPSKKTSFSTKEDYNKEPFFEESPMDTAELDQIKFLESQRTNFVFLFGRDNTGKTAVIASILRYLASECRFGNFEKNGNDPGQRYARRIENEIMQGILPKKNPGGSLAQIEGSFLPNPKFPYLQGFNLTFLDASGADLSELSSQISGKFPSNLNIFFKSRKLSMLFILVVPVEDLKDDDHLMSEFIDFVRKRISILKDNQILLLVTKWDKTETKLPLEYLLKFEMPETLKRLNLNVDSYGNFTLGTIYEEDDGTPFIQDYDYKTADTLFRWIYLALTGKRIS
ncbi:MAG TPA: serine/threonine-protein kinase [Pyrinomonadaceae bacterium]